MYGTLDAIKANPELGVFQFRATNTWVDGAHNRSTIQYFYGAGQEDTSRREAFTVDAGEPSDPARRRHRPEPGRAAAVALAACLTTTLVYVATARKVQLTEVSSILTGDMDVRGALGVSDEVRNGFTRSGSTSTSGATPPTRRCTSSSSARRPARRSRHGDQRRAGRHPLSSLS